MERGQKREPQNAIDILDCCSRLFLGDDNNSVFTPRGCARESQANDKAGADHDGVEIREDHHAGNIPDRGRRELRVIGTGAPILFLPSRTQAAAVELLYPITKTVSDPAEHARPDETLSRGSLESDS